MSNSISEKMPEKISDKISEKMSASDRNINAALINLHAPMDLEAQSLSKESFEDSCKASEATLDRLTRTAIITCLACMAGVLIMGVILLTMVDTGYYAGTHADVEVDLLSHENLVFLARFVPAALLAYFMGYYAAKAFLHAAGIPVAESNWTVKFIKLAKKMVGR